MNSEKIMKDIGIGRYLFEHGGLNACEATMGCGDGSSLESVFHDGCLIKMIPSGWAEGDCEYKILNQYDEGESDISRTEVWQAGAFSGWYKNCTCCGRMVRRDKIHISVSEDVMEFDEFGNGATMLSNHEVLLFCGKECLLESLLKESIGAEHVLDWISEWE